MMEEEGKWLDEEELSEAETVLFDRVQSPPSLAADLSPGGHTQPSAAAERPSSSKTIKLSLKPNRVSIVTAAEEHPASSSKTRKWWCETCGLLSSLCRCSPSAAMEAREQASPVLHSSRSVGVVYIPPALSQPEAIQLLRKLRQCKRTSQYVELAEAHHWEPRTAALDSDKEPWKDTPVPMEMEPSPTEEASPSVEALCSRTQAHSVSLEESPVTPTSTSVSRRQM